MRKFVKTALPSPKGSEEAPPRIGGNLMTDLQKSQIIALREQGYGYATIASSLGLTKNQVSAFCRRNQLTGTNAAVHIEDRPDPNCCRNCGKPLTQTPGRKPVKFCSDACRMAWWNAHPERVQRKAYYTLTCRHCGKQFESYGNSHRVFCSRDCYLKFRRKEADHE